MTQVVVNLIIGGGSFLAGVGATVLYARQQGYEIAWKQRSSSRPRTNGGRTTA